ncbi:hypothetical protein Gferi_26840 [Geosporobacter ferrireducens]|uniref:AI-2E family transporter n=1 Tax=Geosporobacter ferrireducens TaxID=1424294 RepID=A0A1D8GQV9_9FIRM|nr:hypothetical protein Gferi_26840 [Geosporobacter ferrireducens]
MKINKKHFYYFSIGFIGVILFIFLYNFRNIIWQVLPPLLWSILFAYLLNPIVNQISKYNIPRIWSVLIVYSFLIAIIFFMLFTLTPKISKEMGRLIDLIPIYSRQAGELMNRIYSKIDQIEYLPPEFIGVEEAITENLIRIQVYLVSFVKNITTSIFNVFTHLITLVLIPVFTFYFLKDASYFKKKIILLLPKSGRSSVIEIAKDIDLLISRFIRGQLIVAAAVGILSIAALLLIRIEFAFLIGFIAGVSNVIPYFGPIIGSIPGVIIALLDEPSKAIWVIIAFTIIQQIESAIISPKIVGESVGLHPIMVILVLIVGNMLYGIIGMLFAVPIAASVKIICHHIIERIVRS